MGYLNIRAQLEVTQHVRMATGMLHRSYTQRRIGCLNGAGVKGSLGLRSHGQACHGSV